VGMMRGQRQRPRRLDAGIAYPKFAIWLSMI
jgi:hypothetical protein